MITTVEPGKSYKFLEWTKCHVIAVVESDEEVVVVFKRWNRGNWRYVAEPRWAFLRYAEERTK